jgi:hypothetical protein
MITPPLSCSCDAVPGNDTIVGELVGPVGVEVGLEVPFPVTLRFRQICFTRVPNAGFLIRQITLRRKEEGRNFLGRNLEGVGPYLLNLSSYRLTSSADKGRR